jgi:hypothetical protein
MQTPSTLRRLKTTEIATTRAALITQQGGRCGLCKLTIVGTGVLDHDHTTGAVRAGLHSGCNSLLGKVENNHKRYGVPNLAAFASGVADYLSRHAQNQTGLLHPTHKTDDEKRIRRNTLARKARATKATT